MAFLRGLAAAAVDTALLATSFGRRARRRAVVLLQGLRGAPQDQPVQVEAHVGE